MKRPTLPSMVVFRLVLAVCFTFLLARGAEGQSDLSEANALIIIKASAGAPPNLVTWNGTDPCGSAWLGVQCTPANGSQTRYVTGLQLPGFGLKGSLSPALGLLPNLQILDLSQNQLEGGIPREFQNLTKLEQLDLHGNNLVALLDPWVGSMLRLVRMDLSRNSVWGTLSDNLFRLTELQQLNLGGCVFTGAIPTGIANLSSLRLLDLSFNYLKGPIPETLGQMTQLQALLLQNNTLTGTVPSSLANLPSLSYLYLQGNNLTGTLPSQLRAHPNLIARYDGNPLCQQPENQALCAVLPRNTPPDPETTLTPMPPPAPITISTSAPGVSIMGGSSSTALTGGQTPLGGTCVPGTTHVCACGDGKMGQGVCAETGTAIVDCSCKSGSSGGHGLNTMTVLVAVLAAVLALGLSAVAVCCVLVCMRRRNKQGGGVFVNPAKSAAYDVEIGREVPSSSSSFPTKASFSTPLKPTVSKTPKTPKTPKSPQPAGSVASSSASTRSVVSSRGGSQLSTVTPPPPPRSPWGAPLLPNSAPSSSGRSPILVAAPGTPGSTTSTRFASAFGGDSVRSSVQDDDKGSVFSLARSQLLNPLYEGPRGGQKNPLYEGGADGPKPEDPHLFSFEQLAAASDNFSAERLLGGSGFGRVYLCAIEGRSLVVKRLNDLQTLGALNKGPLDDRFEPEVGLMARLDHPHVMRLVGYCNEGKERCLVSPYMINKCLHERLHGSSFFRMCLDWQQRLRIAAQAAGALAYLHNYGIVHRNFCSSNVLLDVNMRAVVTDFGLARLSVGGGAVAEEVTSLLVGASGYMAPEYGKRQGDVTEKADVYSFGVVLLELMTGRRALSSEGEPLAHWAAAYIHQGRARVDSLIDPQLKGTWPSLAFFWTAELAGACIDPRPAARPDMADVAHALSFILQHALDSRSPTGEKEEPRHIFNSGGNSEQFELPDRGWISPGEIEPSTPSSDSTRSKSPGSDDNTPRSQEDTPRSNAPRSGGSLRHIALLTNAPRNGSPQRYPPRSESPGSEGSLRTVSLLKSSPRNGSPQRYPPRSNSSGSEGSLRTVSLLKSSPRNGSPQRYPPRSSSPLSEGSLRTVSLLKNPPRNDSPQRYSPRSSSPLSEGSLRGSSPGGEGMGRALLGRGKPRPGRLALTLDAIDLNRNRAVKVGRSDK